MNNVTSGIIAGFVATVVLSALMVAKAMMGLMPELDVIAMLAAMSGTGVAGGWVIHFVIGALLWGSLFAALHDYMPGDSPLVQGLSFSVVAWFLMMVIVMPAAGAGLFAASLGVMAAVATLVLHVIYGAVLGWTYGKLVSNSLPARSSSPGM